MGATMIPQQPAATPRPGLAPAGRVTAPVAPVTVPEPGALPPVAQPPAAERAAGADADISSARRVYDTRGPGDASGAVPADGRSGEPGTPQDRAEFRAQAIALLRQAYGEDPGFQRAMRLGTLVIRTLADQPAPEMRPELSYAVYRAGAMQSAPDGTWHGVAPPPRAPVTVRVAAPQDFIAWWPRPAPERP